MPRPALKHQAGQLSGTDLSGTPTPAAQADILACDCEALRAGGGTPHQSSRIIKFKIKILSDADTACLPVSRLSAGKNN